MKIGNGVLIIFTPGVSEVLEAVPGSAALLSEFIFVIDYKK